MSAWKQTKTTQRRIAGHSGIGGFFTGRTAAFGIASVLICGTVLNNTTIQTMAKTAYASMDVISIDSQLKKDAERLHIPGMAVVIVSPEETLFAGTYGVCDSIDTPFILGSVSKSFTALSIMQLVEAGKVSLDETVSHYIDASVYSREQ